MAASFTSLAGLGILPSFCPQGVSELLDDYKYELTEKISFDGPGDGFYAKCKIASTVCRLYRILA